MLTSIIIPARDSATHLAKAVGSALSQSHHEIEVIIVDDGSRDSSRDIARSFMRADPRVSLLEQHNQGVSAARNAGVDHSTGELICFLDSDDLLHPDAIRHLNKVISSFSADIAIGGFTSDEAATAAWVVGTSDAIPLALEDRQETIEVADKGLAALRLLYGTRNTVWGALYKRSVVSGLRFDTAVHFGEDTLYNLQAFYAAERIAYSNAVLYFYRLHPMSAMMVPLSRRQLSQRRIYSQMHALLAGNENSEVERAVNYHDFINATTLAVGLLAYKAALVGAQEHEELLSSIRANGKATLLNPRAPHRWRAMGLIGSISPTMVVKMVQLRRRRRRRNLGL